MECKGCGQFLSSEMKFCEYCGREKVVETKIAENYVDNRRIDNSSHTNYIDNSKNTTVVNNYKEKWVVRGYGYTPWWRTSFFTFLLLVFLYPIGLILMLFSGWRISTKIVLGLTVPFMWLGVLDGWPIWGFLIVGVLALALLVKLRRFFLD